MPDLPALPLQVSLIQARQAHCLHRVKMPDPGLCRVSHGTKRVFLGEQTVEVSAGQWLLLPAHVLLGVENRPGPQGYLAQVLSFPQQLISEFHQFHAQHLPQATGQPSLKQWHVGSHARLDVAWHRLLQSLSDQEPLVLTKHLFYELLLILGLSGHLSPLLGPDESGLSLQIQQWLMSAPSTDWLQDKAAARFHMSVPTLRRRLAAEGQSFRSILNSVRMTHALHHLQISRLSIEDIAQACGYASASRFATRFRQQYGLSPRALRKAMYA